MISHTDLQNLTRVMPFLKNAAKPVLDEFMHHGYLADIQAGRDVFVVGDRANAIALLLDGVVRVYIVGETGREITLYRFGSGESCVLTATAILNEQEFPAIALVEKRTHAVMIPEEKFREWVGKFDIWRDFMFSLYSRRLFSMMAVINEVVFHRMDQRIAAYLFKLGANKNPVIATHQEIASELGSSREVISRLLESFQAEGYIQTQRGSIDILNFPGLEQLSDL